MFFNVFFICLIMCVSSLKSDQFDDLLKILDSEGQTEKTTSPAIDTEKNSSDIQQHVSELTEELKKLNIELKKVIGPESEKQVAESKKKRQDREKEWEKRSKEGKSRERSYYPSSSRSSRGYGDYGSSGYSPSGYSYTPSRGKSYSGSSFGDKFGSSPWDSDFGSGKSDLPKSGKDTFGKGSEESSLKLDTDKDNNKKDKQKKKGTVLTSKLKKDEKAAIKTFKSCSESIKDSLNQMLRNLDEVQPSQQQALEAREKNYSNILTEDDTLSELRSYINKRKDASKTLPKKLAPKHAKINDEEKHLWRKFLPHLIRMLVFFPHSEELEPISPQKVSDIRSLIRLLDKEKLIPSGSIKFDQEKIEAETLSRINTLRAQKSNDSDTEINEIIKRIHNLPNTLENVELKNLVKLPKKDMPEPEAKTE